LEGLTEVREHYRVLINELNKTIYCNKEDLWEFVARKPNHKERLAAIKLVAQMELGIFKAELTAGIYVDQRMVINPMFQQEVLAWNIQTPITESLCALT
jgi:hypothetical protein